MPIAIRFAAFALAACLTALGAGRAQAVGYDEAAQGDLSGNPAAPTSLGTLPVGSHSLRASFVSGDYDLVTFTIAAGTHVDSIFLNSYAGSTSSFSGIQSGSTWTAGLGFDVNPAPLLGWVLFGENTIADDYGIDDNLLYQYATGEGAIGFTPPLGPGTYTLQLQETGPFAVNADFTLNVVPEPSTLTIAAFGFAALFARRKRLARNCGTPFRLAFISGKKDS
jgi:hypothetical protein